MTDHDVLDSGYSWRRLGLSLALSIVGNVGMWAVILVLPSMQAEFGLDRFREGRFIDESVAAGVAH